MTTADFILWSCLLFAIIFVRYLVVSGTYHYLFRLHWKTKLQQRIFHHPPTRGRLMRKEILRAAGVSIVFAVAGISTLWLWQNGYTQLYLDIGDHHWIWLVLSPLLFLASQETYYYWTHRWMHLPGVYERVHAWHHESIETTAFTAFSFHPLEAILQAIFFPLVLLVLPLHVYVFFLLLALMTLSATINHAGVEVFPASWSRIPMLRRLIGATHHDLHHKQARTNFGLYFTYWDEWMGTESSKYKDRFERVTGK
jgi:lathosterol oxidase